MRAPTLLPGLLIPVTLFLMACNDPARPGKRVGKATNPAALCVCKPTHITKDDWRIEFKNESLPKAEPVDISAAAILQWAEGPEPGSRSARSGREMALYRVPKAYLQTVFFRASDCDLHLEISEEPSKTASRMIVETPGTQEYCLPRASFFADLERRGITITDVNQELSQPFPVEVIGVAFRDQVHPMGFARGSDRVDTLWELHPATVRVLR
ncbi:MAG TPA: hypothetical protein VNX88_03615 [Terriglobales bacterium]|nr:hypothetical protein [Terriglobales bacterium]